MALRHKWKQRQAAQAAVLREIADRLTSGRKPVRLVSLKWEDIEQKLGLTATKITFDDLYDTAEQTEPPEAPSSTGRGQGPGRDRWTTGAGGPHAPQLRRRR